MMWTVTGILVILWLVGVVVSCIVSGPALIVFLIISVMFLFAALVLIKIMMKKKTD